MQVAKRIGGGLYHVKRVFLKPLRFVATQASLWLSEATTLHGLRVVDMTSDRGGRNLFPAVGSALALIEAHDPGRLARMRDDVRRILIVHTHGSAGEYWEHVGAVVLDAQHLQMHGSASVAMTLIHEAMHARLARLGQEYTEDPGGVERLCVEEEIDFASRVPGTERLVEGARLKLATEWWSTTSGERLFSSRLRALGVPRWMRKTLRYFLG